MRMIKKKISLKKVESMAKRGFGDMVKAVVDVEKGVIVMGGELHADQEAVLLANGSKQDNLWGVNLYPFEEEENWLEFDSMINLRPWAGNMSRTVESKEIRRQIKKIIDEMVER